MRAVLSVSNDSLSWRLDALHQIDTHTYAEGHGGNTAFLHGFAQTPAAFLPVTRGRFTDALFVAIPGHAGTKISLGNFEDTTMTLAENLVTHRPTGVHLVGYSLGGRVALSIALNHPQLAKSLTLISAQFGLPKGKRIARKQFDEDWATKIEKDGLERFATTWRDLPIFQGQAERADASLLQLQESMRRAHSAPDLAISMRTLGLANMPDYTERLRELQIPFFYFFGEDDLKCAETAKLVVNRVRGALVFPVPGAGHNLLVEKPDRLGEELRELIAKTDARTLSRSPALPGESS